MAIERTDEIANALIDMALGGDLTAMREVLARTWPHRRGALIDLRMPPIRCAADVGPAYSALIQQICDKRLTPDEAEKISALLERQARAYEVAEFAEQRAPKQISQHTEISAPLVKEREHERELVPA